MLRSCILRVLEKKGYDASSPYEGIHLSDILKGISDDKHYEPQRDTTADQVNKTLAKMVASDDLSYGKNTKYFQLAMEEINHRGPFRADKDGLYTSTKTSYTRGSDNARKALKSAHEEDDSASEKSVPKAKPKAKGHGAKASPPAKSRSKTPAKASKKSGSKAKTPPKSKSTAKGKGKQAAAEESESESEGEGAIEMEGEDE